MSEKRLLNVGCGSHFHPAWTNIDIISTDRLVLEHDITESLPFPDASFDALYCSHVVEHLDPADASRFMTEARRVLSPGGIARIVVPDLEMIARTYLSKLEDAAAGKQGAENDYDWILLELYDQTVRRKSGGQMAEYMTKGDLKNKEFILSRIGREAEEFMHSSSAPQKSLWEKARSKSLNWIIDKARYKLSSQAVRILAGRDAKRAFDEGLFRSTGEIHRWMYDRFSMGRLLRRTGFGKIEVCQFDRSAIPEFNSYALDAFEGKPRKPDSLYIEARSP